MIGSLKSKFDLVVWGDALYKYGLAGRILALFRSLWWWLG